MSMRFLLAAVPILLLAAACGGEGGSDGLERISRLNLEGTRYEIGYQDRIVPPIASPYPALVARVNGETITGAMLTLKQVELAVRLQNYPELAEQAGAIGVSSFVADGHVGGGVTQRQTASQQRKQLGLSAA